MISLLYHLDANDILLLVIIKNVFTVDDKCLLEDKSYYYLWELALISKSKTKLRKTKVIREESFGEGLSTLGYPAVYGGIVLIDVGSTLPWVDWIVWEEKYKQASKWLHIFIFLDKDTNCVWMWYNLGMSNFCRSDFITVMDCHLELWAKINPFFF